MPSFTPLDCQSPDLEFLMRATITGFSKGWYKLKGSQPHPKPQNLKPLNPTS